MKRGTWALAATAVVLLAYILVFERGTRGTGVWMREARRLLPLVPEDVASLEIERGGDLLRCQRRGREWAIVHPVESPADAAAVEGILATLENLDVKSLLAHAEAEEMGVYGLDVPGVVLRVAGARLGEREIRFGAGAPLGGSVYVQISGRRDVLIVDSGILGRIDRPWIEFRDRQLLRFAAFDAEDLEIRYPEASIRLMRADGAWVFREPAGARADRRAVQEYLGAATSLRAADFIDDAPADLRVYGLDPPNLDVSVRTRDGGSGRLMVGSPPPEHPQRRYAKTAAFPFVVAVNAGDLDPLRRTSADLRDRQVLEFVPETVQRVRIRGGQGDFVMSRGESGWTAGDEAMPGDAGVINGFLRDLRDLEVIAFVDDSSDGLAGYGLEPPAREILLEPGSRGPAPAAPAPVAPSALPAIMVGREDGEGGVYLRRADEPFVVKVNSSILAALDRAPVAWRDRQVLVVPAAGARRVVEEREGRRAEILRDETGTWRLPPGVQGILDSAALELLLSEIVTLRAERYLADGVAGAEAAGLKDPAVVLRVEFLDEEAGGVEGVEGADAEAAGPGAWSVTLAVGRADPDGRGRVLYEERGLVFEVSADTHAVLVTPFFRPVPRDTAPVAEGHGAAP